MHLDMQSIDFVLNKFMTEFLIEEHELFEFHSHSQRYQEKCVYIFLKISVC